MLKKLLIIKGKEDSNMEWNEKEFKKMMTPIAKKYHLVMADDAKVISWSYIDNTIEWEGEDRMPYNSPIVLIYDSEPNSLYMCDAYIDGFQLNKISKTDLSKYIKTILEFKKYSETYITRATKSTLVPVAGKFICWKKCYTKSGKDRIVKLEVPASAKRYQGLFEAKFRVSEAKVVGIYNTKFKPVKETTVYSHRDPNFKYSVGKIVKSDSWDTNYKVCSNGIHAFMDKMHAKNY